MLPLEPPKPMRVNDFAHDCQALDSKAFRKKHAIAFLVYEGSEGEWEAGPDPFQATACVKIPKDLGESSGWMRPDYLVFPVRKLRSSSSPQDLATVGRLSNSDICIPDESLSKFHALFQRGDADEVKLLDASLRSATMVNGKPVPNQNQGDSVTLKSGDRLQFGSVVVVYLEANDFREQVARTCGVTPRR
jgi:hypothetical protein